MRKIQAILVASAAWCVSGAAFACPDGYYSTGGLISICLPNSGTVGAAVTQPFTESAAQVGGRSLAVWIQQSRNSSYGTAQPIPFAIRQALTGLVEEDLLNRVRYKVDDNGFFNLGGLGVQYGDYFSNGGVAAVTLNDVIVFANHADAMNNVSLWAHELYHVRQFRDWGVDDFGIRYARDSGAVEGPAYSEGARYSTQLPNPGFGAPPPTGFPSIGFQPPPPQLGVFCLTPYGRFGPGQPLPIGSPCNVPTPNGLIFGQIGF